ncbi:hypothetical protein [Stratiformator vulcanicus]|uniref:Uncharacterized protein n=1 Tax=Stratiformator vulcanicus TaxID=2527980 RepID=A0A517QY14_9PLAN|nr:hypothetical protein [Stratiformator vulcanicus]QDT36532.1 hypothetical protein Pan189_08910 [Stratiformator vulcanicus]
MGWKARVREIADRDPEAVPPELLAESVRGDTRRWPVIQKNAIRNAVIGITLIGAVFWAMHGLALGYDFNVGRLHAALGIASCAFAGLFCLLGESVIEDGVKAVIIIAIGCMFAGLFPLPWCLLPGAGAVVGSVVNGTIQVTLGRYF